MSNNFEPIKIKKAKDILTKNLKIAQENKYIDEKNKKQNIFILLMQLWYRLFRG